MTAHFLKLIRLSTIVGILYLFFTNLFSIFRTQRPIPTIIFTDVFIISIITIITSYALIDTATLASVARLNIGSFTVSLRRDVVKPLILYDDEWNADCLRVREALSSLGIPVLIYPVPKLSSNPQYFNNYPIESRYIADAIMHHPQLEFTLPLLYDPNTGAVLFGDGEKINNYIYSYYSKRLTDVDPPPPLTIGPLDLITSKVSIFLRYGSRDGPIARPSIYNKSPLHLYGNQADGGSRIVREWLCRLQLSYLLFPTSRGSMYRAVLTHQVGSFYYSQRSKLIYERFNILVSYEHQRKEILEGLKDVHSRDGNGNDWNLNLDRFGLIDRKYPHNNRHHRYKKRDQDDIDMDISPDLFFANQDDERMIDFEMANKQRDPLPTAQSLQESVILKDPKTNQFTIVQNHGKKQTEMDGFEFGQKLQKYGYYDEVKSPNQSNAFNNVSGTHVNLINPRQDGVRVRSNTLSSKLGSKNGQPEGANDDNILMLDRIIQDAERRNNEQLEKAQEFASASPLQQPQQSQQPQPQQPQPQQPQPQQPQPQPQQHSSTLARNTPKQQPQQISKPFHYPQHNPDPNSNKSLSYLPPTNPPLTPLFASGPKNNSQYQDSLRDESLLKIMKPVQPQDGNQITEYQYVLDNDNLKSSNRKGYLGDNSPDSHSSSYPTAHTHKTTPNQLIDDSDPLPDLQTVPLGLFESQPPQDQKISSTHISPYSDDGPIPGLSLMPSLLQPNPSLGSNMSHVHCLPNDNYGDVKKGPVGRHYGSDRHNLCGKNPPSNPVSPRSGQSGNSPLPKQKEEILQSESPAEPNVDERLLMTSLSTFQRSVGLVMLYDPNTEITAFGTDAAVRYIKLMYSFDTSGYQGNDALGSMLLSPLQNGTM